MVLVGANGVFCVDLTIIWILNNFRSHLEEVLHSPVFPARSCKMRHEMYGKIYGEREGDHWHDHGTFEKKGK